MFHMLLCVVLCCTPYHAKFTDAERTVRIPRKSKPIYTVPAMNDILRDFKIAYYQREVTTQKNMYIYNTVYTAPSSLKVNYCNVSLTGFELCFRKEP